MKILLINGEKKNPQYGEKTTEKIRDICAENDMGCDVVRIEKERAVACTACGKCMKRRKCIFEGINDILESLSEYDGVIVLSSLVYGRVNQETVSFLERLMRCGNDLLGHCSAAVFLINRQSCDVGYGQIVSLLAPAEVTLTTDMQCGRLRFEENGEMQEEDEKTLNRTLNRMFWSMRNGRMDDGEPIGKITDYMR
ncbi:MAG: hypothetical protein ACI32N_08960 [Bulleidia sp.]